MRATCNRPRFTSRIEAARHVQVDYYSAIKDARAEHYRAVTLLDELIMDMACSPALQLSTPAVIAKHAKKLQVALNREQSARQALEWVMGDARAASMDESLILAAAQ